MATTWTEQKLKAQRLARDNNSGTLTQLEQDMNTGYHLFNARLSRYYTRKQQFTDLIDGQQIYQTPVDCVRVMGMTVLVSQTYQPTVKEIRSEYQWRQITSYPYNSNWPAYYFMIGNDELALWPTPSQDVVNGLRFYYQPQDYDLSIEDATSTSLNATATVTNGSTTVTLSSSVLTSSPNSLWFQVTGETNNTFYEIVDSTSSTLTLKSAYVSPSGSGKSFRIGQLGIIPQEYSDAPMHYALGNYFMSKGNSERAQYHLGTIDRPGLFYQMMKDCEQEYSSSNMSNVISDDDTYINPWMVPPIPGPLA